MWGGLVQFGVADGRWLVDPVGGHALDEDVDGGLFAGHAEEGVVHLRASAHGDVEVADVGEAIGEQQATKHVAALAAHAGAGVGELDVFVDVLGREVNDA